MIPNPSPDPRNEDACRQAAAQLQHDHMNWLVMWGCYTHSYVAFPLFHAPRGTVLTGTSPGEIATKMRWQERSARVPPPGPPPEGPPAPGWGRRSLPQAKIVTGRQ